MNYPERLREGDTVALLAPSSPISAEDAAACRRCFEKHNQVYLVVGRNNLTALMLRCYCSDA